MGDLKQRLLAWAQVSVLLQWLNLAVAHPLIPCCLHLASRI